MFQQQGLRAGGFNGEPLAFVPLHPAASLNISGALGARLHARSVPVPADNGNVPPFDALVAGEVFRGRGGMQGARFTPVYFASRVMVSPMRFLDECME